MTQSGSKRKIRVRIDLWLQEKGQEVQKFTFWKKTSAMAQAERVSPAEGRVRVVYDPCCYNEADFYSAEELKRILGLFTERPLLDFLEDNPCPEGGR